MEGSVLGYCRVERTELGNRGLGGNGLGKSDWKELYWLKGDWRKLYSLTGE